MAESAGRRQTEKCFVAMAGPEVGFLLDKLVFMVLETSMTQMTRFLSILVVKSFPFAQFFKLQIL